MKASDESLADAHSVQVGGQLILDARQFPINFEATCDPSIIEPRNTYVVKVRITDGQDKLLFINTQSYPVLTRGYPTNNIDIVVEQVN